MLSRGASLMATREKDAPLLEADLSGPMRRPLVAMK
jgi:hypothetical protein